MTLSVAGGIETVSALFEAGAVGFYKGKVIRFKSGILSPGAYLNNRVLPSWPAEWDKVMYNMTQVADLMEGEYDVIASVATGGIAHGAALTRMLDDVPHVIVKKEEKSGHGLKGLIDGDVSVLPGSRVLLIEDMSSTFESSIKAMGPLEANEATVVHTIAISTWDFPVFRQNIEDHDVTVLCTGEQLLDYADHTGRVDASYMAILRRWVANPDDESWIDSSWEMPD